MLVVVRQVAVTVPVCCRLAQWQLVTLDTDYHTQMVICALERPWIELEILLAPSGESHGNEYHIHSCHPTKDTASIFDPTLSGRHWKIWKDPVLFACQFENSHGLAFSRSLNPLEEFLIYRHYWTLRNSCDNIIHCQGTSETRRPRYRVCPLAPRPSSNDTSTRKRPPLLPGL